MGFARRGKTVSKQSHDQEDKDARGGEEHDLAVRGAVAENLLNHRLELAGQQLVRLVHHQNPALVQVADAWKGG